MADENTEIAHEEEPIIEEEAVEEKEAGEEAEEEAAAEEEPEADDGKEPPVRKRISIKDHIIERKQRQIEKLKAAKEGEGEESEEEAPAAVSKDALHEAVAEAVEPITKALAESEDEKELLEAFTKRPEAKKYEAQIRRFMSNPAYSLVPVEFIINGILGDRAAKKQAADEEAKGTRQGGHQRRPTKEKKERNAWEMTPEEFAKESDKIRSGITQ